MRGTGDFDELRQRRFLAPNETARTVVSWIVGLAALSGVAAIVTVILGSALDFDAAPVATVLGIAAGVLLVAMMAGFDAWSTWTWHRDDGEVVELAPTPVPEQDAIELARRRALTRRIQAQRAARSQRAASGGSVSSTEAGRPSQGSSEATTDP